MRNQILPDQLANREPARFIRYDANGVPKADVFSILSKTPDDLYKSNHFCSVSSVVTPPAISFSHRCADADLAPNNSIIYVEATVVIKDSLTLTGGVTKIAALFSKDGAGVFTQIGATQVLLVALENVNGPLTADFGTQFGSSIEVSQFNNNINSICIVRFDTTVVSNY